MDQVFHYNMQNPVTYIILVASQAKVREKGFTRIFNNCRGFVARSNRNRIIMVVMKPFSVYVLTPYKAQ
jgi:hypothetical protein